MTRAQLFGDFIALLHTPETELEHLTTPDERMRAARFWLFTSPDLLGYPVPRQSVP